MSDIKGDLTGGAKTDPTAKGPIGRGRPRPLAGITEQVDSESDTSAKYATTSDVGSPVKDGVSLIRPATVSDIARPTEELLDAQVAKFRTSLEDVQGALSELRRLARSAQLDEAFVRDISSYCDGIELATKYVGQKIDLLIDVDTSGETRVQIAAAATLQLENAISEGEGLERSSVPAAEDVERCLGRCGKILRKAMGDFWRLVSGLLTPKEWVIKGEVSGVLIKGSVEIKFGQ